MTALKNLEVMKLEVRYAKDNYAKYVGLVKVVFDNNVTNFSAQKYVDFVQSQVKTPLKEIFITKYGDKVVIDCYDENDEKFERIVKKSWEIFRYVVKNGEF